MLWCRALASTILIENSPPEPCNPLAPGGPGGPGSANEKDKKKKSGIPVHKYLMWSMYSGWMHIIYALQTHYKYNVNLFILTVTDAVWKCLKHL